MRKLIRRKNGGRNEKEKDTEIVKHDEKYETKMKESRGKLRTMNEIRKRKETLKTNLEKRRKKS